MILPGNYDWNSLWESYTLKPPLPALSGDNYMKHHSGVKQQSHDLNWLYQNCATIHASIVELGSSNLVEYYYSISNLALNHDDRSTLVAWLSHFMMSAEEEITNTFRESLSPDGVSSVTPLPSWRRSPTLLAACTPCPPARSWCHQTRAGALCPQPSGGCQRGIITNDW